MVAQRTLEKVNSYKQKQTNTNLIKGKISKPNQTGQEWKFPINCANNFNLIMQAKCISTKINMNGQELEFTVNSANNFFMEENEISTKINMNGQEEKYVNCANSFNLFTQKNGTRTK